MIGADYTPQRQFVRTPARSFHEKAGMSQGYCSLYFFLSFFSTRMFFSSSFLSGSLRSSRAASVAFLPSALLVERFSLGAWWAFPIQKVLRPDNRPWLASCDGSWART